MFSVAPMDEKEIVHCQEITRHVIWAPVIALFLGFLCLAAIGGLEYLAKTMGATVELCWRVRCLDVFQTNLGFNLASCSRLLDCLVSCMKWPMLTFDRGKDSYFRI